MVRLFKEIFILLLTVSLGFGVVFYVFTYVQIDDQFDSFNGTVDKKELRIASPVFGTIESLPVYEGQLIKKNTVLATISQITIGKDEIKFKSSVYQVHGDLINVIAPEDSIVSQKLVAEKSIIKPEVDFIVMYPLNNAQIKIVVPKDFDPKVYKNFFIQEHGSSNKKLYPAHLLKTLPVDIEKSDMKTYYVDFNKKDDSKNFYKNEAITVKAEKANTRTEQLRQKFNELKDKIAGFIDHIHKFS